MSRLSIAILGPGGVGGFLAAALARTDATDVTVVAREETAALIAREGVRVESVVLGDVVARPAAAARLDADVDVLVVATKAVGLDDALARVRGEPALVVPLLNGLDHLPRLRERFGPRAVAGTIRIEADRPEPGRVVQTSPRCVVDVASEDAAVAPLLEPFAEALRAAGVPARVGAREAQVLWSKLVRLNALACTTSAWDAPLGEIREDPQRREALEGCVREAAAVANAEGAAIDPAATIAELEGAHATLGSSMQRDIAAGRAPELDAIAGAVLRAGARHGLACPTVRTLAERVAARAGIAAPAA